MSYILSASRSKPPNKPPSEDLQKLISGDETVDLEKIDFESHTRLDALRDLQARFQRQARRSSTSYNFLIFGQYVVGAVLASAFFNNVSNMTFVSLLGALVLVSSAVQQRFRPDVLAMQARYRAMKCNKYIRQIEDSIFEIKCNKTKRPSILAVRQRSTKSIDELEANEYSGFESYYEARKAGDDER